MNKSIALTALAALLLTTTVQAEEPSTYSPEHCEFAITFPEEPYKTQKCDGDNKDRCYEQTSYTQVFELDTTVNFRVICNKIDPSVRETYSGDIMQATLRAMTKDSVVDTFNTTFRETDHYKQAGLVGEGQIGRSSTIYIAQLWIGDNSAFSVEAELIGNNGEKADKLFSTILRSAHNKEEQSQKDKNKLKEKTEDIKSEEQEKPQDN